MKLKAFKATKLPLLNTDHHSTNQNTPATRAKKIKFRVQKRGGGGSPHRFLLNGLPSTYNRGRLVRLLLLT